MNTLFVALLVGIVFVGFAASVIYTANHLKEDVPVEDREFLDPLPRVLTIIWPAVRFVDYYIFDHIPTKWFGGVAEKLKLSGLSYLMSASQFMSLCLVSALMFLFISYFMLSSADMLSWAWVMAAAVFGFSYPRIWLSDSQKRRQKKIVRALPTYLDFLTMGVEGGLNMAGAIKQAVDKGPAGPLKNEFALVLRDLRAGMTRSEALRRMDQRLKIGQVTSVVNAIVQADRLGASLGPTFRYQAEQRRTERFQLAEKLAMEAPVKLIFPLVIFIFPITFVVIMFPIAMKFLQSGVSF